MFSLKYACMRKNIQFRWAKLVNNIEFDVGNVFAWLRNEKGFSYILPNGLKCFKVCAIFIAILGLLSNKLQYYEVQLSTVW